MANSEHIFFVHTLTRKELRNSRPDAIEQVNALNDAQMQEIAEQVGRLLQDEYGIALAAVLIRYLPPEPDKVGNDDE